MTDPSDTALAAAESAAASASAAATAADYAADSVAAFAGVGTVANQLADRIDGYADHGDVSGPVTFNGPTGSHWFDATAPTTITLAGFAEGQVVSLLPFSGAADVTVTGLPDLELTDGLVASAMLARGVWVTGGGGGGTPATPDTTPPTAVTDLVATGGEGQIVLTWSAATDAESSVAYRYRAWLTSGGATGAWTSTTTTAATITGLAAGAYTAEVYAYSNGGASATDTATATVTASLGYDIGDDFNAANTTSIAGRVTPVGAKTWAALATDLGSNNVEIISGKATSSQGAARVPTDQQNYVVRCTYNVPGGASSTQVRVYARSGVDAVASATAGISAFIRGTGFLWVSFGNNDGAAIELGSGQPTSGELALEVNGTTGRVLINDVQVGGTFSIAGFTGANAGLGFYSTSATADNFEIEYL